MGSNKRKDADAICNYQRDNEEKIVFNEFDHDYDITTRLPELDDFVTDVVKYKLIYCKKIKFLKTKIYVIFKIKNQRKIMKCII